MAKYINPFTDIGFKRIFGQELNKPLLIDFLNNLLKGERHIIDLKFLDKELPAEYIEGRSLIYDIYCETADGERIIVEMQNRNQSFFKKRSIFYVSEAIARQGMRGSEWDYDIQAVYLVAFLNFKQNDIGTVFRTDVALMDMKTKEHFSEDVRMIFLQLPYFEKPEEECNNDFERWIYVLKHMEALSRLPWVAKSPIFSRLAEVGELSALSQKERVEYDAALRVFRDNLCAMKGAEEVGRKQGFEQGIAEGMAKGEAKATLAMAKRLKEMNISVEDIQKATSLSIEEIKDL